MPSPGRSAGTESEIPWIPRCSDVVELGWGVGQWLGSQILGGVDIVNIKIYPFSQTLPSPSNFESLVSKVQRHGVVCVVEKWHIELS